MSLHSRLLALTGVIPPFLLLWFAERFERRVREPTQGFRYRILAATALSSVPIAWIERAVSAIGNQDGGMTRALFDAYVVAAGVEEAGKFACVLLLTRGALGPRTRYGAMLYTLHASMGFALVENVLALLKASDMIALSTRFFLRAYLTVPMHLVAGGTAGFLWARRRFDRGAIGLAGGLGIAIAIHGTFNAALLALEVLPQGRGDLRMVCASTALAIPLLGVVVLRALAGALRRQDQHDAAATASRPGCNTAIERRAAVRR